MLSTLSKHLRYTTPLAAIAAILAGAACGGTGGSSTGTGGTGGGSTTTTTSSSSTSSSSTSSSSGSGGEAPTCPGKGYGGGETPSNPHSVTAIVVDQNGAPVADQPVYICGTDICSDPGKTGADGK